MRVGTEARGRGCPGTTMDCRGRSQKVRWNVGSLVRREDGRTQHAGLKPRQRLPASGHPIHPHKRRIQQVGRGLRQSGAWPDLEASWQGPGFVPRSSPRDPAAQPRCCHRSRQPHVGGRIPNQPDRTPENSDWSRARRSGAAGLRHLRNGRGSWASVVRLERSCERAVHPVAGGAMCGLGSSSLTRFRFGARIPSESRKSWRG